MSCRRCSKRLWLTICSSLVIQYALSFQLGSGPACSSCSHDVATRASLSLQKAPPKTALHVRAGVDADARDFYQDSNHQPNAVKSEDDELASVREQIQPHFPFPLDTWQLSAASSILSGHNLILCAPTGSGKTVVGEIALRIALQKNTRAIYTTPLKALSNQKFGEMQKVFGVQNVGLATGDICIRRGSDVMVMTTEVYRNMAWRARSSGVGGEKNDVANAAVSVASRLENARRDDEYADLSGNSIVVLDEFHYMGEKGRGSTWEESVIFNPAETQIVGYEVSVLK